MGDWVANRVIAAPAVAPMRTRKVLRIIREPFRCRVSPTTGLDRRETRLYGTRYIVSAGWDQPPPFTYRDQPAGRSPSLRPGPRATRTVPYRPQYVSSPTLTHSVPLPP